MSSTKKLIYLGFSLTELQISILNNTELVDLYNSNISYLASPVHEDT